MMLERLLKQSFLHGIGRVRPPIQALRACFSLTFIAVSPVPAFFALALVGLSTGAVRATAGFADSCKKASACGLTSWHFIQRQSCIFAFPTVPQDGVVLAQAGALTVNLWLCAECVQSPKTFHPPIPLQGLAQPLAERSTAELSLHQNRREKEGSPHHPSHKVLLLDFNVSVYWRFIKRFSITKVLLLSWHIAVS